jgi:hypothetical protein
MPGPCFSGSLIAPPRAGSALDADTTPLPALLSKSHEGRRSSLPRPGCGANCEGRCWQRYPAPASHRAGYGGTPGTCFSVHLLPAEDTKAHRPASRRQTSLLTSAARCGERWGGGTGGAGGMCRGGTTDSRTSLSVPGRIGGLGSVSGRIRRLGSVSRRIGGFGCGLAAAASLVLSTFSSSTVSVRSKIAPDRRRESRGAEGPATAAAPGEALGCPRTQFAPQIRAREDLGPEANGRGEDAAELASCNEPGREHSHTRRTTGPEVGAPEK